MPQPEVLEAVLGYLRGNSPDPDLQAESNLEGLLAESLALMELIIFLEDEYGLQFQRADLDPENFSTPQRIVQLVLRKQAS